VIAVTTTHDHGRCDSGAAGRAPPSAGLLAPHWLRAWQLGLTEPSGAQDTGMSVGTAKLDWGQFR